MKNEIYVSTDIETDGPIPGENSMLSFASVAFTAEGMIPGAIFTRNLALLPGAIPNPKTSEFWASTPQNQAAYFETRKSTVTPEQAMYDYRQWLYRLGGKPVFVAYPAGFDFTFVYWYLIKFAGQSPFSHSALDMKTLAMAILGTQYRNSTKRAFPDEWFPLALPHTHVALDDALEQARICHAMLVAAEEMRKHAAEYVRFMDKMATTVTDLFLHGQATTDVVSTTYTEPCAPGKFSCCEGEPGERSI